MKTRVVVSLDKLAERWTGLQRYSHDLAIALGRAAPEDIELVYLTPMRGWRAVGGTGARRRPLWPVYRRSWQERVRPVRSRQGSRPGRPVVWHALAQDAKYLPLDSRIPVVLTFHDMTALRVLTGETLALRMRQFQANVDRAAVIVTSSHFAADEIRQHLRVGDKPIEVIYHGLTIDTTAPSRPPSGLGEGPFLVAVGRAVRTKNLHALIDMMTMVDGRLLLVGGDDAEPYADELRHQIGRLGLDARVKLLGPVGDAELLWLYQNARAVLQPSLAEGFGLPVIEAMACGTPVFLARRTSLPEVGGPLAFYWDTFEPDAMVEVFERGMASVAADPEYPNRLKAHAATFSWADAAEAYLNVYRRAAGSADPAAHGRVG